MWHCLLAVAIALATATSSMAESAPGDIDKAGRKCPVTETIVTRADNGKTVAMHVGEKLVVRLEESPSTGFTWAADKDGDRLVLVDSNYVPSSAGVGGGGLRTFTFMAKKAGLASLRFKHWREWEGESSVSDVFAVDARIDAK